MFVGGYCQSKLSPLPILDSNSAVDIGGYMTGDYSIMNTEEQTMNLSSCMLTA